QLCPAGGGAACRACLQRAESCPTGNRDRRHNDRAGGYDLQNALLDRNPQDVGDDHGNTSEVESPPWSRTSCARAGPSRRSWKSTKKSGSTAIEPSPAMSILSRYERSPG